MRLGGALVLAVLLAAAGVAVAFGGSASTLRVTQVIAPGSPLPVEGAIPYIRVARGDGSTVVKRRLVFKGRKAFALVSLAPGRYRLQSWQRVCDGNCGILDPPSDRCARWLRIHRAQRLDATITVRYGSGCRIRFG